MVTGVKIGEMVGTGATVVTNVGTYLDGTITAVVPGIVTISQSGTDVGTLVIGTITGLGGKVGTTMNWLVGTPIGMLYGVTMTVLCCTLNGTVGAGAIDEVAMLGGKSYVGMMT
jgi:hypothetical protein